MGARPTLYRSITGSQASLTQAADPFDTAARDMQRRTRVSCSPAISPLIQHAKQG
jgi:hypothetical protein